MEPKRWAVLIHGSDDLHACRDKEVAEAVALLLNRQGERIGIVGFYAEVVLWPHSRASWKEACEKFRLEIVAL